MLNEYIIIPPINPKNKKIILFENQFDLLFNNLIYINKLSSSTIEIYKHNNLNQYFSYRNWLQQKNRWSEF